MTDIDLSDLINQSLTSLYSCIDNISKYLDTEREDEINKFKSYVGEYCLLDIEHKRANEALDCAKNEIDSSNIDTLQEKFTKHLGNISNMKQIVDTHTYMLDFNKRVRQTKCHNVEQNLDESDLAITETQDRYIDPISKKPIENPVKNSVCGHVYEKKCILELIRIKPKCRCPVAGCGNRGPILNEHLQLDEELRFRIALTQHSTMIEDTPVNDNTL